MAKAHHSNTKVVSVLLEGLKYVKIQHFYQHAFITSWKKSRMRLCQGQNLQLCELGVMTVETYLLLYLQIEIIGVGDSIKD